MTENKKMNATKYKNYVMGVVISVVVIVFGGCNSVPNETLIQPILTSTLPNNNFTTISSRTVSADGVNTGLSAYQLITNSFGKKTIESPDLYSGNHTEVVHIIEDTDAEVGNHFVFLSHRDADKDRNKDLNDRQRNEIKTLGSSDASLLGYEGETVQYHWLFKVNSEMELSRKFSHFFQIKAKNASQSNANGNDEQPIFTLSGAQHSRLGNELQVRYNKGSTPSGKRTKGEYLARVDWDLITDEWIEVIVQVTYAEQGRFALQATRLSDKVVVLEIERDNIDTWRGNNSGDFARPKWGIYRSITDKASLRAEEEQVRFADFTIRKGVVH